MDKITITSNIRKKLAKFNTSKECLLKVLNSCRRFKFGAGLTYCLFYENIYNNNNLKNAEKTSIEVRIIKRALIYEMLP